MQFVIQLVSSALVTAAALAPPAAGQVVAFPREHHPWGRFQPGAWKVVRVVTSTIDAQKKATPTSTTETRTRLEALNETTVKLTIETSVEVADKKVDAQPQTVVQGYHGESTDQPVSIKDLGPDKVTIGGREIPCRVRQLETTASGTKTIAKTWYSESVAPYVLMRESVVTELESGAQLSETKVHVIDLDAKCLVLGKMCAAVELEVTHKHAKGHTKTHVWTMPEVPGGIVAHESTEYDAANQPIRSSKLELLGYGLK